MKEKQMNANEQTTEAAAVKELALSATVSFGEYPDKETHEMKTYINIMLTNPFGEEFADTRLVTRWDNDKGIFNLQSKRYLKNCAEFSLKGLVKIKTYYSKKGKRMVSYPAIYLNKFYGTGELEFQVKDDSARALFSFLLSELWDEQLDILEAQADDTAGA